MTPDEAMFFKVLGAIIVGPIAFAMLVTVCILILNGRRRAEGHAPGAECDAEEHEAAGYL